MRKWRKKRIAKGLCAQCGKPRNGKSTRFCDACLGNVETLTQKLRDKRAAENRCTVCGEPKDSDKTRCAACATRQAGYVHKCQKKHAKKYNAQRNKKRREQQEKGLCIHCKSKRSDKSRQLCDAHLEAQRLKRRDKRRKHVHRVKQLTKQKKGAT